MEQSLQVDELIVVDDGSTDRTSDALLRYGNQIHCVTQPNCGVSSARNRGIELASGDFVAFLDSDDQWLPRMVEEQVKALEKFPMAVAAAANGLIRSSGPDRDIFGTRQFRWPREGPVTSLNGISALLLQPVTSGVMVRRDVLNEAGRFDVNCQEFEDFDLWSRISLRGGWAVVRDPQWIHFREVVNDENVSQQYWKRPVEAYGSLLRSYARMLNLPARSLMETCEIRRAMGNCRSMMGAAAIDRGVAGGRRRILRSLADWPSPRRIVRAAAMVAGWRPARGESADKRWQADCFGGGFY